jgi:hypothetical protein
MRLKKLAALIPRSKRALRAKLAQCPPTHSPGHSGGCCIVLLRHPSEGELVKLRGPNVKLRRSRRAPTTP